ncbi:MAG: hypothetical protein O7A04_03455 [Acidobacteria bacterium]|nr:hypothetical protein [Acidobacteriota bacterium]
MPTTTATAAAEKIAANRATEAADYRLETQTLLAADAARSPEQATLQAAVRTRRIITASASITYNFWNARKCEIIRRAATVSELLRELDKGRVLQVTAAGSDAAIDTPLGRYIVAAH